MVIGWCVHVCVCVCACVCVHVCVCVCVYTHMCIYTRGRYLYGGVKGPLMQMLGGGGCIGVAMALMCPAARAAPSLLQA